LEADCSNAPITSSLTSPDNHSSIDAYLHLRPCSLSTAIGRISSNEFVAKFSTPFFVDANNCFWFRLPVILDPFVINWIKGPFALDIAVLNGAMVSSACFIVGAVTICWVVDVSISSMYACKNVAYRDFAAPRPTIRYCLLTNRLNDDLNSHRPRSGLNTLSLDL